MGLYEVLSVRDQKLEKSGESFSDPLRGLAKAKPRQTLREQEKEKGADDKTLDTRASLARNLWYQGRNAEAETLLRELIREHEKNLGTRVYVLENNVSSRVHELDTFTPLECRTLLANTLRDQGKCADAEAEYKQVIQAEENVLGPEHRFHHLLHALVPIQRILRHRLLDYTGKWLGNPGAIRLSRKMLHLLVVKRDTCCDPSQPGHWMASC